MTLKWKDVERAIEDLVAHEEGIKFQRIAISLAKERWHEVVATEVKKDGGEDGLTHSFLTKDGRRFDIACSITATYEKVKEDLKRIYGRGVKLDLLVFYTPNRVFQPSVDDWKKKAREAFECELLVISREDVIQELLRPPNQWICSTFLGLEVAIIPTIKDTRQKAIDAIYKVLDQWKTRSRFSADNLINLNIEKLDEKKRSTREIVNQQALCMHLGNGGRAVLVGGPGSGKTTTLIQICAHLLTHEQNKVPLLVSLPEWIESGNNMLSFITQHPYFISTGVSADDLALLHESGQLVFVLNGWNEISAHLMAGAGRQLARLDREFPASGIIIATRESDFFPPLIGILNLRLTSINNSQRRLFVKSAVSERAVELLSRIEGDKVLSEITRTPLILSELIKSFKLGWQIPRTRFGILQGVIRRTEESEEHSIAMKSEPIQGRSTEYLKDISAYMTQEGRTVLDEAKALSVISSVNENLKATGQLAILPNPKLVLDTLCAHHLIKKSIYPVPTVSFIHQQFQELYAAIKIREKVNELVQTENVDSISEFQFNIINLPTWEEPLKLLAEELRENNGGKVKEWSPQVDSFDIGLNLVKWSMPIDPIFAAQLANLCDHPIWNAIKEDFGSLLRRWYNYPHDGHKACALAAMFASGKEDFSDIIWLLLESSDQQIRLKTFRTPTTFFMSCLGNDWHTRVTMWDTKRRQEFISEVIERASTDEIDDIAKFAMNDPSTDVRVAALTALGWRGALTKFYQLLDSCNDETFKAIAVNAQYLFKNAPNDLWPKIKAAWKEALLESKNLDQRLRIVLRLSEANKEGVADQLKAVLKSLTAEDLKDYQGLFLKEVLERVETEDPQWVSTWVACRQAEGMLRGEQWASFIKVVPTDIINGHFDSYLDPEYADSNARRNLDLIAKCATSDQIQKVLQKMIELEQTFTTSTEQHSELMRNFYWRLKNLLYAFPLSSMFQSLLNNHSMPDNIIKLSLILEFLCRNTDFAGNYIKESIGDELLEKLRLLLRSCHSAVLKEDDFTGELKSHLSTALSIFGEREDMLLIEDLIRADIIRRRQGAEAFQMREHHTPKVNGFRTDWSNWHINALCRLDPEKAEELILNLIDDFYYENAAGSGLIKLLHIGTNEIRKSQPLSGCNSTSKLSGAPPISSIDKERKKRFSAAIVKRINLLKQNRKSTEKQNNTNARLKAFAAILSAINEADDETLILEIMALPGEWDGWTRIRVLETLIQNGIHLDMASVEKILNPTIKQLIDRGVYSSDGQNAWLLKSCLFIFAKTNDPQQAVARIKEIASEYLGAHDMRDIIIVLGENRSREAAKYLIELAQDEAIFKLAAPEIIRALANSHSPEGVKALLSMIDPKITDTKLPSSTDYYTIQTLAQSIADLCIHNKAINDRVFALCEEHLQDTEREIVAKVILKLSSLEAVIKGLNLISDKDKPPIPYFLWEALKNRILNHVPISELSNSFQLEPHEATEIRSRLFNIAMNDEHRNRTAFELLGDIEQLRLEYGRPATESRHPDFKKGVPWPIMQFCE